MRVAGKMVREYCKMVRKMVREFFGGMVCKWIAKNSASKDKTLAYDGQYTCRVLNLDFWYSNFCQQTRPYNINFGDAL